MYVHNFHHFKRFFLLFFSQKIGATISENESFSLASYELDGLIQPTTYSTTQQSSNLLQPEIEAAAFNQEQQQLAAAYDQNTIPSEQTGQKIQISPEKPEKSGFYQDAEIIEAIQSTKPMLPVNHVIQYSPRTSAASAPDWTASVQLYNNQNSQDQTSRDSFKLVRQTSSDLSEETQFQIEEATTADDTENKIDIPEPMEIDTTSVSENEQKCDEKAKIIDQTADQNINDLVAHDSDLEEVQKNLVKSPHENQQRESFSCPLYPHKTIASLLVTTTEVQVQLDHDQNLNSAGAPSIPLPVDIKGDINIPPIQQAPQLDAVLVHNSAAAPAVALGAMAGAAGASGSSPPVTPTGSTRSKTPSPRPRSSVSAKQNSTNMDTTEIASMTAASNDSAASIQNDNAASNKSSRVPVPTPRKSVTMMECEDQTSSNQTPVPVRSNSAMGNRQIIQKKISFSNTSHMPVAKKLSTFSLHEMHHNTISIEEDSGSDSETEQPLQRRNSIHNVPYVDVSDPQTRERMERYKEERRSMLRAKYKAEDYMTSPASSEAIGNKYRRKSTESQQSNKIEQTSETCSPPPPPIPQNEPPCEPPESPVILRKDIQGGLPKMSSPLREDGLIDEDVNVKERAAIFGGTGCQNQHNLNNQNQETVKQNQQNASQVILPPPKYNRSKSMWTNSNTNTSSSAKVIKPPRPISDDPSSNNGTSRKISPGSPSKIRDMAAFFEQHQKN